MSWLVILTKVSKNRVGNDLSGTESIVRPLFSICYLCFVCLCRLLYGMQLCLGLCRCLCSSLLVLPRFLCLSHCLNHLHVINCLCHRSLFGDLNRGHLICSLHCGALRCVSLLSCSFHGNGRSRVERCLFDSRLCCMITGGIECLLCSGIGGCCRNPLRCCNCGGYSGFNRPLL